MAVFRLWLDPESVAFNLCIPASNRTDCMALLCRWFEDVHDASAFFFFFFSSKNCEFIAATLPAAMS